MRIPFHTIFSVVVDIMKPFPVVVKLIEPLLLDCSTQCNFPFRVSQSRQKMAGENHAGNPNQYTFRILGWNWNWEAGK